MNTMAKSKPRPDGRYVAVYRKKYFYGRTPEEARKKRDDYKERHERGLDPALELVADYATDWLPINRHAVSPKTMALYQSFIRILSTDLDGKTFSDVRPSDIKRIYSTRFRRASDSHIRHFRNLITAIFDSAVEDGYAAWNPCRSKKAAPHKGTAGTHRAITDEERALIENTPARLQPLAMTMLYAGLRDSEALALNVGRDVDFRQHIIRVRYFRHVDGNHVWVDGSGKTPAAVRDIPLDPVLENIYKNIPGLLITDRSGNVLSTSAWRSAWKAYINTLEVARNGCRKRWYGLRDCDKEDPPPPWKPVTIKPCDLRHSYCCRARDRSVDMHVLQVWMGHSDITMIMRVYDHVSADRIKTEAEKLTNGQNNGQPDPDTVQEP